MNFTDAVIVMTPPSAFNIVFSFFHLFGLSINVLCAVLLYRTRISEDTKGNIGSFFSTFQAACDATACCFSLIMSLVQASKQTYYYCQLVHSANILWTIIACRVTLNFVVCCSSFIKITYPFLNFRPSRSWKITIITSWILLTVMLTHLAHWDEVYFDETTGACENVFNTQIYQRGLIRVLHIFSFVYHCLFPLTAASHLYKKLLKQVGRTGDTNRRQAYRELNKTRFCDVTLMSIFIVPAHLLSLIGHAVLTPGMVMPMLVYQASLRFMSMYSTLAPIYSMIWRRAYYKMLLNWWQVLTTDSSSRRFTGGTTSTTSQLLPLTNDSRNKKHMNTG